MLPSLQRRPKEMDGCRSRARRRRRHAPANGVQRLLSRATNDEPCAAPHNPHRSASCAAAVRPVGICVRRHPACDHRRAHGKHMVRGVRASISSRPIRVPLPSLIPFVACWQPSTSPPPPHLKRLPSPPLPPPSASPRLSTPLSPPPPSPPRRRHRRRHRHTAATAAAHPQQPLRSRPPVTRLVPPSAAFLQPKLQSLCAITRRAVVPS